MKPSEYVKNQQISESNDFVAIKGRLDDRSIRLLHSAIGLNSELAELIDAIKKDQIDWVNVAEEAGDCYWYASVAISEMGINPEEIMYDDMSEHKIDLLVKDYESVEQTVAGIGWAAGHLNDCLKKAVFYGKPLDSVKVTAALGALTFALSGVCYVSDTTPGVVRERNIAKLKVRYAGKFTAAEASERDLETERKALEGEKV